MIQANRIPGSAYPFTDVRLDASWKLTIPEMFLKMDAISDHVIFTVLGVTRSHTIGDLQHSGRDSTVSLSISILDSK